MLGLAIKWLWVLVGFAPAVLGVTPGGWQPQQQVTVAEAVKAYTYGAAYAEGEEKIKGTIEARKLANLTVLQEDIFAIDPIKIQEVKVDSTYLGGALIYSAKHSPQNPE
jgi:predicted amidohydrolase YtcJ